ncbi:RluA family pseudouridine synthase [Azospirillum picis]|uniref:Pseudouridine synthase n=1 Tax=Azospirillum picis TaxID=488438 RepID=A0ABU0MIZ1_9PROT|nr:RluA family pseudouridine synthase [Azospirillum picis]MBP2299529.1 23S rRNA pseudouridine955/2504/2580 synthase [Azospirillum picis]MDQ0533344.1 23S rRNA pseudouridine955/2504/2580 synthase [Azospirillum picis]
MTDLPNSDAKSAADPEAGGTSGDSKVELRKVMADEADMRLDRWFKRHFPDVNHSYLQKLLRTGQVRIDGKRAETSSRLLAGQSVRIPPLAAWAAPVKGAGTAGSRSKAMSDKQIAELQALVLYRDADVIAINKPAGLAVQGGTGTSKHLDAMLDALRFDGAERPKLVHRLDKDTSGVLLLARTSFAATKLTEMFRGSAVRKIYWAATVGVPKPYQGKIDLPLAKEGGPHGERVAENKEEGKRAVTVYSVQENAGKQSAFVAMWPLTGRTHQLRVHMAAVGTPILGDGKYAGQGAFLPGAEVAKKLHLHARRLVLPHPRGGKTIDVTAPLPDHMQATWKYLGFSANLRGDPFEDFE